MHSTQDGMPTARHACSDCSAPYATPVTYRRPPTSPLTAHTKTLQETRAVQIHDGSSSVDPARPSLRPLRVVRNQVNDVAQRPSRDDLGPSSPHPHQRQHQPYGQKRPGGFLRLPHRVPFSLAVRPRPLQRPGTTAGMPLAYRADTPAPNDSTPARSSRISAHNQRSAHAHTDRNPNSD